jgi:hypothetical protein
MKATRTIIAAGLLFATTAIALGQQKPAQQPPPRPPPKPSDLLSMFFHNHLDRILSPIGQPKPVPLPRVRVTELREQFTNQGSKAPEAKKPMYEAAVAVCDAISYAMDERQKAIASLQGSAAVPAPSDLGAHRTDLSRNPWIADLQLQREGHEEQNRKQEARQTDNFFTTQQKNQWIQRTIQLRQQIDRLYAREREAERAAEQAKTIGAGAESTAESITLDKAVQVKIRYGTATILRAQLCPS